MSVERPKLRADLAAAAEERYFENCAPKGELMSVSNVEMTVTINALQVDAALDRLEQRVDGLAEKLRALGRDYGRTDEHD